MRINQLPTFGKLLTKIKQLEEEDCCGFDDYHGWGIGICKHNEWKPGTDESHPKTISVIISGEKVDNLWIENYRKEISLLFNKYLIPLERKDEKWHRISSKEEILNSLKKKWEEDWFEYRDEDVEVEWGNEEQITELLLKFLKDLKKLYE